MLFYVFDCGFLCWLYIVVYVFIIEKICLMCKSCLGYIYWYLCHMLLNICGLTFMLGVYIDFFIICCDISFVIKIYVGYYVDISGICCYICLLYGSYIACIYWYLWRMLLYICFKNLVLFYWSNICLFWSQHKFY